MAMFVTLLGCAGSDQSADPPAQDDTVQAQVSNDEADVLETSNDEDDTEADAPATDLDELPAAEVARQGFNHYDGAVTYTELVAMLGAIPPIDGDISIGFTAKAFENEFWRLVADGVEAAEQELQGLGIDVTIDARAALGEGDELGQLAVLDDMVNRRYSGIMLSPIADGNLLPGVENALREGIPMMVVNDAFMPQVRNTWGAWHLEGAQLAAQWVYEQIGGEGQIAIVQGLPVNEAARIRTDGFREWIETNAPNIEIVGIQNADWDRLRAMEVADIWLTQFPDLRAIYANNDTMAMGVLEAVREADKLGEVLVIGTDGTGEALESIAAGELSATVDNYPFYMGLIGVEIMLRIMGGQDVPLVIYSPQAVIDSTNYDLDASELIGWSGFQFAD